MIWFVLGCLTIIFVMVARLHREASRNPSTDGHIHIPDEPMWRLQWEWGKIHAEQSQAAKARKIALEKVREWEESVDRRSGMISYTHFPVHNPVHGITDLRFYDN